MQFTPVSQQELSHVFTVTVSAQEIEQRREAELQAIGKKVKMQGFRPGKAPASVLRQRYGKEVLGDVLEKTIDGALRELMEQQKLRPAAQPEVKIQSFEEGKDLVLDVSFDVMPQVPELDLATLTIEEYTFTVPESEIEDSLERLRKSRQHTHPAQGPAERGQVVKIDFVGKRDGVAFEGGTGTDFMLELGSGQFIPGFEDQLIGAGVGDVREVSVTFPAQYHNAELAGKPAVFEVTVKEVHRIHIPDLSDSFATSLGFKDLAHLRAMVEQQVTQEYGNLARAKAKKQLFDVLDEKLKFTLPPAMLKAETDTILAQVQEAKKNGDPDLKDKSDEAIAAEYGKIAQRRVKLGIYLSELARSHGLTVSREELSAAVMAQARSYPGQEEKVFDFYRKNPREIEELRGPIVEEKAVDFLLGKVSRKPVAVTLQELTQADAA